MTKKTKKGRVTFIPKDDYYDDIISFIKHESKKDKECPVYPTKETFEEDTRKDLKNDYHGKVIEGMEKIEDETVAVWYFYSKNKD